MIQHIVNSSLYYYLCFFFGVSTLFLASQENGIKAILSMGYEQENFDKDSERAAESQASLSKISLNASLSASNIASHRNLRRNHQMLIAETIYNPSIPLVTKSRLCESLIEILSDNNCLSYFVQLLESQESLSTSWIRLWVQIDCFKTFFKETQNCDNKLFKSAQIREDAIKIYEKFLTDLNQDSVKFDFDLNEIRKRLFEEKTIDEHLFDQVQKGIEDNLEKDYLDLFLKSSYYCRYQLDILTNGSLCLADILYNDSILFYFMEFMEQEGMKHYIDFLMMAENCRRCDCQTEDYLIIFNKFFSPHSPCFLEMSDSIRCQLEKGIQDNVKFCFDKPMSILMQYFERTYFKQFLQSPVFISYLTECINSLQNYSTSTVQSKESPALRQESSSSKLSKVQKSVNGKNRESQTNSSLQFNDFDDIWKRNYAGDLQIAYVDKYGKLMSNFEPEPGKVNSNGISLSKLGLKFGLNGLSDEKEKEELAWEVAQMIIDDVQNLTNPIDP